MQDENNNIFMQLKVMGDDQIQQLLEKNKSNLQVLMNNIVGKVSNKVIKFDLMYESLLKIQAFVKKQYFSYLAYCKQKSKKPVLSLALKDVSVSEYNLPKQTDRNYFKAFNTVDDEIKKEFFESSDDICIYHLKKAVDLYFEIYPQAGNLQEELERILVLVADESGDNLFSIFVQLLESSSDDTNNLHVLVGQIKKILAFAHDIEEKAQSAGIALRFNTEKCYQIFNEKMKLFDSNEDEEESGVSAGAIYGFNEPVNMLQKIFEFVEINDEDKNAFLESLNAFKKMPDKKSADDDARKLRRTLSARFYDLYEKVFIKSEEENADGVVLDLFLNFGVVDETMFKEETLNQLMSLSQPGESNNASVYTIRQWLHAIYAGEKQPSRNDLDMDYKDYINDKARRGEITEEEKTEYLSKKELKINYEIQNFMRMNSRLTNGELSVFCPVLTQESLGSDVASMYVTDKALSDAIDWLLHQDFSVFHREQLYDSRENGIVNMVINKQVFPDIVLMPVVGAHSRMWQEIDGKRRDTPGRFTFPAFTKQDLKDLVVAAAGSFRWQLCKKIQGNYWNVVSERSLTSEYYDYIQFYKKNRDLSDQAKEKIGSQLQRARNNFADCFAMDYAIWIKNEVAGSVRLNKIVREIMATYCTPVKEIRESLKHQPLFVDAFARFDREHAKKLKEITNRRAAIRNANGTETPEFIEEARFREEL